MHSDRLTAAAPPGEISAPSVEITAPAARHELDLLVLEQLRLRALERLLFVQCGDGWAVEEAWRRVTRSYVCGVDTSPTLVARAAALRGVPGKVEFDSWDGCRLPLADGSFDWVVSRFAFEQCSEPDTLLREIRRVLRGGGELYLLEVGHDAGARGAVELQALLGHAGFVGVAEPALKEMRDGGLILRAQRSPG